MTAKSLRLFDEEIRKRRNVLYIAGFDEAGRGPLAGPVSCAGVLLPPDYDNPLINDSKKLTDHQRRALAEEIKRQAIAYHVELVGVETIDRINILEADRLGMEICLNRILDKNRVDFLITDYMKLRTDIETLAIAKGDATSLSVAAASILAKVTRDDYMIDLDEKYPNYDFKHNKGYGTKRHLEALEKYGPLPGIHRLSFSPVREASLGIKQLSLFDDR